MLISILRGQSVPDSSGVVTPILGQKVSRSSRLSVSPLASHFVSSAFSFAPSASPLYVASGRRRSPETAPLRLERARVPSLAAKAAPTSPRGRGLRPCRGPRRASTLTRPAYRCLRPPLAMQLSHSLRLTGKAQRCFGWLRPPTQPAADANPLPSRPPDAPAVPAISDRRRAEPPPELRPAPWPQPPGPDRARQEACAVRLRSFAGNRL